MPYLLDTSICVFAMRQASSTVSDRLDAHRADGIVVPAIAVAELRFGADRSRRPQRHHRLLDDFFAAFSILPFDELAGAAYGQIRRGLERAGTPIGPLDLLIAAQALSREIILVTHNVAEFSRVSGLSVEDWAA